MANINMDSILEKAKQYMNTPEAKRRVEKVQRSSLSNGNNSASVNMHLAAEKFIEVLKNEISSRGIAISDAVSLEHGRAYETGSNMYQIEIWFSNDLHRDSLVPDRYEGIDNIVALFNNGYSADGQVYGMWHGKEIASLKERVGENFIDQAVRDFIGNYGSEYNVIDIKVDPIYR